MATQTESVTNVFKQAFDSLRKTAEANLEMQQELFRQWGANWPGFPQPQNAWVERAQKFQKEWAKTVRELLSKHREILDEQYQLAVDSLDEAFRVAQSSDPQDFAKKCEALCKKSLEVLREAGELQVKETQEALNKWIGLAVKAAG
jgi:plasmid replication initiation protein